MIPKKRPSYLIFALVFAVAVPQISQGGSSLGGRYVYDSNHATDADVHKVLLEYGFEKDDLESFHYFADETTKEIEILGGKIKMTNITPRGRFPHEFEYGKEEDELYLVDKPDYMAKTTVTMEDDKLTFKRKMPSKDKAEMTETWKCEYYGCSCTMSAGKESAIIHWKRTL